MKFASNMEREIKAKLVIVDDDSELNRFFCQYFSSLGLDVLSALSLAEARGIVRENPDIDLMLIDQNLGDGFGLDLVFELKQTASSRILVIMISINDDEKFVQACFDAGASDYLSKPVSLLLLKLKVESLLQSSLLNQKVSLQNRQLEQLINYSEQEKEVAKFTFDQLRIHHHENIPGVVVLSHACTALNGDFAICRRAPNGNILVILADATGHGLSAAISIMPVVTVFGTMVAKGFDISQILMEINRKLLVETPLNIFVAALVLELDVQRARLSVWNGGMPDAYWISDEGERVKNFPSRHMALGILANEDLDVSLDSIALEREGYFFACSDGVTEQRNAKGEAFGSGRLFGLLQSLEPAILVNELRSKLQQHAGRENFDDDISLCLLDPIHLIASPRDDSHRQWSNHLNAIAPFTWSIRLCGLLLERQPLPPLVNQYLKTIGAPEDLCKVVFTVIAELVSNSLDHGILGLDSSIKEAEGGFLRYLDLRHARLSALTDSDAIELTLELRPEPWGRVLEISLKDTGRGYDLISPWSPDKSIYSGRGLGLVSNLFDELEVLPPGNHTRARLNLIS